MFKTYVVNTKFTLTMLKQLVNSGCIMSSKVDMITFIQYCRDDNHGRLYNDLNGITILDLRQPNRRGRFEVCDSSD